MLQVGLSWCWIGITAYLWGYAGIRLLNGKREEDSKSLDLFMFLGICFLTVFAEFFSLFYKVGALANIILMLVNGIIIIVFRRKLYNDIKGCLILHLNYRYRKPIAKQNDLLYHDSATEDIHGGDDPLPGLLCRELSALRISVVKNITV